MGNSARRRGLTTRAYSSAERKLHGIPAMHVSRTCPYLFHSRNIDINGPICHKVCFKQVGTYVYLAHSPLILIYCMEARMASLTRYSRPSFLMGLMRIPPPRHPGIPPQPTFGPRWHLEALAEASLEDGVPRVQLALLRPRRRPMRNLKGPLKNSLSPVPPSVRFRSVLFLAASFSLRLRPNGTNELLPP